MAEKYEWGDEEEEPIWRKDSQKSKYGWGNDEEEEPEWINWKKEKNKWDNEEAPKWMKDSQHNQELTPDQDVADMFLSTQETLIKHNKRKIEVIKRSGVTGEMAQYYQGKINDLITHIEELSADFEIVRADPTIETVNRIIHKK